MAGCEFNVKNDLIRFQILKSQQQQQLLKTATDLRGESLENSAERLALIIFNSVCFPQNVKSYLYGEKKRTDQLIGSWEVLPDRTVFAEGFGTPEEVWENTRIHNPSQFSEREKAAALAGFRLLVSGEADAVFYPMFDKKGVRYIPGMRRVGNTIVNISVDVGKLTGDLTYEEGGDVIRLLHRRQKNSQIVIVDEKFPLLALKNADIDVSEVQQAALSRRLLSEQSPKLRNQAVVKTDRNKEEKPDKSTINFNAESGQVWYKSNEPQPKKAETTSSNNKPEKSRVNLFNRVTHDLLRAWFVLGKWRQEKRLKKDDKLKPNFSLYLFKSEKATRRSNFSRNVSTVTNKLKIFVSKKTSEKIAGIKDKAKQLFSFAYNIRKHIKLRVESFFQKYFAVFKKDPLSVFAHKKNQPREKSFARENLQSRLTEKPSQTEKSLQFRLNAKQKLINIRKRNFQVNKSFGIEKSQKFFKFFRRSWGEKKLFTVFFRLFRFTEKLARVKHHGKEKAVSFRVKTRQISAKETGVQFRFRKRLKVWLSKLRVKGYEYREPVRFILKKENGLRKFLRITRGHLDLRKLAKKTILPQIISAVLRRVLFQISFSPIKKSFFLQDVYKLFTFNVSKKLGVRKYFSDNLSYENQPARPIKRQSIWYIYFLWLTDFVYKFERPKGIAFGQPQTIWNKNKKNNKHSRVIYHFGTQKSSGSIVVTKEGLML